MHNKKTVWILLTVFVLLLGGAYTLYTRLSQETAPNQLSVQGSHGQGDEAGQAQTTGTVDGETASGDRQQMLAQDFKVYDLSGREVRLSDYIGKPIVLNFWASWCGPCQMEMPDFQEKYLELGDKIQFLMVNMTDGSRETVKAASDFIADKGYTFPVFYDTASDAAQTYRVYSLPTTYFIDAQGYLIAQASGAIDAQTLQKGIDLIS